jgi:hypothetical protein
MAIGALAITALPVLGYAKDCPNPASEVLVKAGKAILSGPTKQQLCINDHQFVNVKQATLVRGPDGKMVSMTGKMSHQLRARPDDQIYYTVNFVNGVPDLKNAKISIDRGGVAALIKLIASPLETVIVAVSGVRLNLQDTSKVASKISRLVEGRGWEWQAEAMIDYAAVYAALPPAQLPPQLR